MTDIFLSNSQKPVQICYNNLKQKTTALRCVMYLIDIFFCSEIKVLEEERYTVSALYSRLIEMADNIRIRI